MRPLFSLPPVSVANHSVFPRGDHPDPALTLSTPPACTPATTGVAAECSVTAVSSASTAGAHLRRISTGSSLSLSCSSPSSCFPIKHWSRVPLPLSDDEDHQPPSSRGYSSSVDFTPLKGILKKPTFLQRTSVKRKNRGVTFCLPPPENLPAYQLLRWGSRTSVDQTFSSSPRIATKVEKKRDIPVPLEQQNRSTNPDNEADFHFGTQQHYGGSGSTQNLHEARKSKRKKKKKKRHRVTLKKQYIDDDPMATKAPPGPLSLGLYVFLWIIMFTVGGLFAASEWRTVKTQIGLIPLRSDVVPVSCEPSDEHNGYVVHIDCPLRNLYTFFPSTDFAWNVRPFQGVFFEMRVEMFQWLVKAGMTGFGMKKDWSSNLADTASHPFLLSPNLNPDFFPHIPGVGRQFAPNVWGGGFRLLRRHLLEFHERIQLPLTPDGYYAPPSERPPATVSYANTQVHHDALYTGDPHRPRIGDLRITFWGSKATHVSAIAQQRRNPIDGAFELIEYHDGGDIGVINGTVRELFYEGDYSPNEMFQTYITQHDILPGISWAIRCIFICFLSLLIAFTYRIFDKSVRVAVFPVLAGSVLIALGLVAFCLAPMWLLVNLLTALLYWVASPIAIIGGTVIWKMGKRHVEETTREAELTMTGLLPSETIVQQGNHFYQPV